MTGIANINGKWYAFEFNESKNQVYSIGEDNQGLENGCCYCARFNESGVQYVSTPSPTRHAAYNKAKRAGDYAGEFYL